VRGRRERKRDDARGEMGQSCTVTEVCWEGRRCTEKRRRKAGRKREMELQMPDGENNVRIISVEVTTA